MDTIRTRCTLHLTDIHSLSFPALKLLGDLHVYCQLDAIVNTTRTCMVQGNKHGVSTCLRTEHRQEVGTHPN